MLFAAKATRASAARATGLRMLEVFLPPCGIGTNSTEGGREALRLGLALLCLT